MPALLGNLSKWTSAIHGNEFLTGADSEYHARNGNNTAPRNPALSIKRGVDFAAASGLTGLYFAFGGYNTSDIQSVLNGLGSGFSVRDGGADSVHVVANVPALASLTDAVLSGWQSTYHKTMTAIPVGFKVFATETGNPSDYAFVIHQAVNLTPQFQTGALFYAGTQTGTVYVSLTNTGPAITGNFIVHFSAPGVVPTAFSTTGHVTASSIQSGNITFTGGVAQGGNIGILISFTFPADESIDYIRRHLSFAITG
jgi:hypothetical protein